MKYFLLILLSATGIVANTNAQVVNICTNPAAEQVMLGMYDPATYLATTVINDPVSISSGINLGVSADSLHAYLDVLKDFKNRNTASDTVSPFKGIGAARKWVYSKFQQFSAANENRLLPSYLQFDTGICGITRHKNIFAVLPGTDTADKSIIIIEGHIDSRCVGLCDSVCMAQGMEDNASGTALVMELARVMSKYSFNHPIVFLVVIGEEQGLLGAQAFATYSQAHGIQIKAVQNNDVIGGIICGHTSSGPGCPGYMNLDSTHVRLFSEGTNYSLHKGLCRYIKLQYKEMLAPTANILMGINIMGNEDRIGRGGDHIPFRVKGYTAMRFTSQNENGDANVTASYLDRQHTSKDSLGIDINNDGILDSYFVNFDYLARNTVINGNAAGMIGISPYTPDFTLTTNGVDNMTITITQHPEYLNYRIGVRTTSNDWDTVYTFTGSLTCTITVPQTTYFVSIASVDNQGVESLFSQELMASVGVRSVNSANKSIELLQNKPNPADEVTAISVVVSDKIIYKEAYISIRDLNGKEVHRKNIILNTGVNEVMYEHGFNMAGTFIYTLVVDGQAIQSRRMVFTN